MWHFYCLPGRVITEIGYLFPKSGQISASKRRRESGLAAFLFATVFWVLSSPLWLPLIGAFFVLAFRGVGSIITPSHPTAAAATSVARTTDQAMLPSPDQPHDVGMSVHVPARTVSVPAPDDSNLRAKPSPRPRVVFATPHEVVQPLALSTGAASQVCSATITDHCIER